MLEFIKQNLQVNELYISKDTINKITDSFKTRILENKETFLELYKIDKEKTNLEISLPTIMNLLEAYKNEEIEDNKKELIVAKYRGNPYITVNLCMQALIKKRGTIAITQETMLGINKLLITIFNNVLEEQKIVKMITLQSNKKLEEIKEIQYKVSSIICIGDTMSYYEYYKNDIKNLKYVPFKNIALYCEDEKMSGLKYEMYRYAMKNGIEIEIFDDIDEFIGCVNVNDELENVIVFSKKDEEIEQCKNGIKKYKLYINENPFKNENFKIKID